MDERLAGYRFNLQLFAEDQGSGERTEPATPKKREEARQKGQVFKSSDLNAAVILAVGTVVTFATLPHMVSTLQHFTATYLLDRGWYEFTPEYARFLLGEVVLVLARLCLPIMGATFLAALLVSYMQVGFVFSAEPLSPKPDRINPLSGFKRIFSKRALVEFGKSMAKVVIVGWIVYTTIKTQFDLFPRFVDMDPLAIVKMLSNMIFELALKVGLVLIIIGVMDYFYQWYEYEQSLKMSKYDIRQEYKQSEGDPQLKARQKQIQREYAMRRMMAEVPKADVVITNPTHFAVVLKYEVDVMQAPMVVAKGQDFVAQKIKEIAQEHQVVMVENPPLARTLYYSVEIGALVPEEMYQAVAEVLAFVYRHKKLAL
ncbi:MAG TPA: flagellar biosynthesis protein FlhB [Syntrophomonas sp.]|jgi:flagellar biosynthetic protein FlhB|nr:flagellar biosynthesis protein FlhB [Syntrophomonas sp.]